MRRNLSHAFSDKALRQQEPLIQSYVDLLVHRIGEQVAEGKEVDITRWYSKHPGLTHTRNRATLTA